MRLAQHAVPHRQRRSHLVLLVGCVVSVPACLTKLQRLEGERLESTASASDSRTSALSPPRGQASQGQPPLDGGTLGSSACADCTPDVDGSMSTSTSSGSLGRPGSTVCSPGTYLGTGDAGAQCAPCNPGTFTASSNAETCSPHRVCAAGSYASSPGSEVRDVICSSCPSGTFSASSGADTCVPWTDCLPGEFVERLGSSTADRACAMCPDGETSSVENSGACAGEGECTAGTVRVTDGGVDGGACTSCPAGSYCAGGAEGEVQCAAGTWDDDSNPATPCVEQRTCVAGEYVLDAGDATRDRQCDVCDGENFTTENNESECRPWTTCESGTRVAVSGSPTADRACIRCLEGSFSATVNAPGCTDWTTCTAPDEYVVEEPSATRDRLCAACAPSTTSDVDNAERCSGPAYQMVDGQVAIEAEHVHARVAGQPVTDTWEELSIVTASGGLAIEVRPDTGDVWTDDVVTTAPHVDYRVNFTQSGTFYFHVRGSSGAGPVDTSESVYAAVDGLITPLYRFGSGDGWAWLAQPLTIAASGVHTVQLFAREDGFRADKIVVSTSASSPVDYGPPESEQR